MSTEAIQTSGRMSGKRLPVLILGTVLLLVGIFAFSARTMRGFRLNAASTDAASERVVIAVQGMYCDSCAAGIKAMLKRTQGVIAVDVSYQRKQAVVDYDSQKTTPEKIVEAINNLGYKASIKNKT